MEVAPKAHGVAKETPGFQTSIHVLGQKLLDEIKPKPRLADSIFLIHLCTIYQNQHRGTVAHI